jgi:twinkle protein
MSVTPIRPTGIVPPQELFDEVMRLYHAGGLPKGSSTGWPSLDEFYTVGQGQFTVITGMPGSGKSEFLDAMLVNLAERDDWDFAIHSPENFPTATHVIKLAEKRVRKPFGEGPNRRMGDAEFREAFLWLHEHFFWMDPEHNSPAKLLELAQDRRRDRAKFGIVLDPWNTLDHARGNYNETDYTSYILTEVQKIARAVNAHIWLVVHPAKLQRDRDGNRPIPTPYDISGSAHWYNKADNIICIHRDKTKDSQDVQVLVQKVRFKHIGHIGGVTLKYDRVIGRYFEHDGPEMVDPLTGKPELYADPERR